MKSIHPEMREIQLTQFREGGGTAILGQEGQEVGRMMGEPGIDGGSPGLMGEYRN